MNCVAANCFTPRALGFFFCRTCWRGLSEVRRTRIIDTWAAVGKGDADARRYLGPAIRDAVRDLEAV